MQLNMDKDAVFKLGEAKFTDAYLLGEKLYFYRKEAIKRGFFPSQEYKDICRYLDEDCHKYNFALPKPSKGTDPLQSFLDAMKQKAPVLYYAAYAGYCAFSVIAEMAGKDPDAAAYDEAERSIIDWLDTQFKDSEYAYRFYETVMKCQRPGVHNWFKKTAEKFFIDTATGYVPD